MSSLNFTCTQCMRRLSRLALTSQPSRHLGLRKAALPPSLKSAQLVFSHHLYSTGSRNGVIRKATSQEYFASAGITAADIPPLEFWRTWARPPLVSDLSPEECLETAQNYLHVAMNGAAGWEKRLIITTDNIPIARSPGKWQRLSAYALYYVSVIIATHLTGRTGHIGKHIMSRLVDLDYIPAVLFLIRIGFESKRLETPHFARVLEKLERVLKLIEDGKLGSQDGNIDFAADICTLRAMMYASEKTPEGDNNALRWFRRAYEFGMAGEPRTKGAPVAADKAPREGDQDSVQENASESLEAFQMPYFNPRWQWKTSFALGVGHIHLRRSKVQQARDMYVMAAHDLDNRDGHYYLALVLKLLGKENTKEYIDSLEKAAISGSSIAASNMAARETKRAIREDLSKWEKRKSRVLANEWAALSKPTEE